MYYLLFSICRYLRFFKETDKVEEDKDRVDEEGKAIVLKEEIEVKDETTEDKDEDMSLIIKKADDTGE